MYGYPMPIKRVSPDILWDKVMQAYDDNGYSQVVGMNQFILMYNPATCEHVKLFYSGQIVEC